MLIVIVLGILVWVLTFEVRINRMADLIAELKAAFEQYQQTAMAGIASIQAKMTALEEKLMNVPDSDEATALLAEIQGDAVTLNAALNPNVPDAPGATTVSN